MPFKNYRYFWWHMQQYKLYIGIGFHRTQNSSSFARKHNLSWRVKEVTMTGLSFYILFYLTLVQLHDSCAQEESVDHCCRHGWTQMSDSICYKKQVEDSNVEVRQKCFLIYHINDLFHLQGKILKQCNLQDSLVYHFNTESSVIFELLNNLNCTDEVIHLNWK